MKYHEPHYNITSLIDNSRILSNKTRIEIIYHFCGYRLDNTNDTSPYNHAWWWEQAIDECEGNSLYTLEEI